MFKNAKNVMFDMDEVRKAITQSEGIVSDIEKAFKSKETKIPIGISIPIGTLVMTPDFSEPDLAKLYQEDKEAREKFDKEHPNPGVNGPHYESKLPEEERMQIYAVLNQNTAFSTPNKTAAFQMSLFGGLGETGAIGNNIIRLAAPVGCHAFTLTKLKHTAIWDTDKKSDIDSVNKELDKFISKLDSILPEELKTGWAICIGVPEYVRIGNSNIKRDLSKVATEVMQYEDLILAAISDFSKEEDIFKHAILHTLDIEKAMAINVIKLVEKGTDTEEYLFTGRVKGIVYEVLAQTDFDFGKYKHEHVSIFKAIEYDPFAMSKSDSSFRHSLNTLNSSVLKLANVEYPLITKNSAIPYKCNTDSVVPFNEETPEQSAIREKELKEYEELISQRVQKIGKTLSYYTVGQYMWACHGTVPNGRLANIFVPYGYDLTNSFKAKYI